MNMLGMFMALTSTETCHADLCQLHSALHNGHEHRLHRSVPQQLAYAIEDLFFKLSVRKASRQKC